MFGPFKRDPVKRLKAQYEQKALEARDAQRNGDMLLFAALTEESEKIAAEIERLEAQR